MWSCQWMEWWNKPFLSFCLNCASFIVLTVYRLNAEKYAEVYSGRRGTSYVWTPSTSLLSGNAVFVAFFPNYSFGWVTYFTQILIVVTSTTDKHFGPIYLCKWGREANTVEHCHRYHPCASFHPCRVTYVFIYVVTYSIYHVATLSFLHLVEH
jgi:hypothetical protein